MPSAQQKGRTCAVVLLALLCLAPLVGCVPPPSRTPYPAQNLEDHKTHCKYMLYMPSYYTKDRDWPLVIVLHGTPGFDPVEWQIVEWKDTAEDRGLIVAVPQLQSWSAQGILPKPTDLFLADLAKDEKNILSLIDDVGWRYNVDRTAVLLNGFSAGGYSMWYTGLRNPTKFNMLVSAGGNADDRVFERVPITPEMKKLHIAIWHGRDDHYVRDQAYVAYKWLRSPKVQCFQTTLKQADGGHQRRPDVTYGFWQPFLPQRLRVDK